MRGSTHGNKETDISKCDARERFLHSTLGNQPNWLYSSSQHIKAVINLFSLEILQQQTNSQQQQSQQ